MAYQDKKLGTIFPTRSGTDIGTGNERQMLDAVGDTDGYRTRMQTNPDGSTTILRTRGGFPEFTTLPGSGSTSGGSTTSGTIYMDSGAVDLVAVAPENSHRYDDGLIWYGATTRSYASAQTLMGALSPPNVTPSTPPAEGSAGQSFGAPVVGGVRSEVMTGLLYAKKVCAAQVPPSLFCGKARAYAQAQYGAPLSRWSWMPALGTGYTPYLTNGTVNLSTNSGIYTDASYHHWLLDINLDGLHVTRLKTDPAAEPLRPLLSVVGADHDKIEAYILAYSQPDNSMTFTVPVPGIPAAYMLGYGWKFNWSGTVADIIKHVALPVSVSAEDVLSTHYQLTINRNESVYIAPDVSAVAGEKSRWSAVLSIVEGPVQWKNTKWGQVISFPQWDDYTLGIFGTTLGAPHGDGPVYCFYKRDTREVIRYKGNGGVSSVQYQRVSTPPSWLGVHDWSVQDTYFTDYGSNGLEGADGEYRMRTHTPFTTGFYCPDASAVVTTQSYSLTKETMSAKTYNGTTSWLVNDVSVNQYDDSTSVTDSGPSLVTTYSDGVPAYTSHPVTSPSGGSGTFLGHGTDQWSFLVSLTYDRYSYSGNHSESSNITLVIPFGDAEAVYLWAQKVTSEAMTGTGGTCSNVSTSGGAFITEYNIFVGTTESTYFKYNGAGGSFIAAAPGTGAPPINTNTYDTICATLVTSTGSYTFTPPESMGPFFAGEPNDSVEQTYWTSSSLLGAAFGHGAKNPMGFKDFTDPPPFIGWA